MLYKHVHPNLWHLTERHSPTEAWWRWWGGWSCWTLGAQYNTSWTQPRERQMRRDLRKQNQVVRLAGIKLETMTMEIPKRSKKDIKRLSGFSLQLAYMHTTMYVWASDMPQVMQRRRRQRHTRIVARRSHGVGFFSTAVGSQFQLVRCKLCQYLCFNYKWMINCIQLLSANFDSSDSLMIHMWKRNGCSALSIDWIAFRCIEASVLSTVSQLKVEQVKRWLYVTV